MTKQIEEIKKTVQENITPPFEEFIALETVSTQNRHLRETAEYVAKMFKDLGGRS